MNAGRTPADLNDVFLAIGELKAGVAAIVRRQDEEIENSQRHRTRVYARLDAIEKTLSQNTDDLEEMTPVFKRAEAAEHARRVYKWQARVVFAAIGGAITAAAHWVIKHFG